MQCFKKKIEFVRTHEPPPSSASDVNVYQNRFKITILMHLKSIILPLSQKLY